MTEAVKPSVAIVDDEGDIVSIIAAGLRLRGLVSARAHSATEAKALIAADPSIGVVVADVNMPGQSGLEMAAEVIAGRDEAGALEFIFVTGLGTAETVAEALRQGAFDFIHKPFSLRALMDRVEAACARCAERRARALHLASIDDEVSTARVERERLVVALERSVSALARTEAALDQAEQVRANLFAVISHELRTPLIPVIGLSSLIVEDDGLTMEKARQFGAVIHGSGMALLGLIETALDVLALDQEVDVLKLQHTSLGHIVARAIARATPPRDRQSVVTEVASDADCGVMVDSDRIERAVAALIDNARKASRPGQLVRVDFGLGRDGGAFVAVADDGPGVPENVIAQLGKPFLQADMTATRPWQGAGLGLAFAMRVAQAHKGSLTVRRKEPQGTLAMLSWQNRTGFPGGSNV